MVEGRNRWMNGFVETGINSNSIYFKQLACLIFPMQSRYQLYAELKCSHFFFCLSFYSRKQHSQLVLIIIIFDVVLWLLSLTLLTLPSSESTKFYTVLFSVKRFRLKPSSVWIAFLGIFCMHPISICWMPTIPGFSIFHSICLVFLQLSLMFL